MQECRKKIFQAVNFDAIAFNSLKAVNMTMEEFGVYTLINFHGSLLGKQISNFFVNEPEGKVYCVIEVLAQKGFVKGGENE